MKLMKKARRSAIVMAAGAAASYFLDPAEGEARRRAVMDRVRGLMQMAGDGQRGAESGDSQPGSGARRGTENGSESSASPFPGTEQQRESSGSTASPGVTTSAGFTEDADVLVPEPPAPESADGPGHPLSSVPPTRA